MRSVSPAELAECVQYMAAYTLLSVYVRMRDGGFFLNESFVHTMAVVTVELTVYEPHSKRSKCSARIC